MGRLLHLPSSPDFAYPAYRLSIESPQQSPRVSGFPRSRAKLRAYLSLHQVKGTRMSKIRTPFVGSTEVVTSPDDNETTFTIKRIGNREYLDHQNINKTIRYVQKDSEDGMEYASERDFPMGDMKLKTILLALSDWNITDAVMRAIPINEDSLKDYLSPDELDFVYDKVLDVNPILRGDRGRERKNDS